MSGAEPGKSNPFCLRPFWQSTHFTQEYLGIGEETSLVRFFLVTEDFLGDSCALALLSLLEISCSDPRGPADSSFCLWIHSLSIRFMQGPALMNEGCAMVIQIPSRWCLCTYQRCNPSPVSTLGNLLAYYSGDKQIGD